MAFTSVPGEKECLEAVWSQGRSCRTCKHEGCYRRGWDKSVVDADNKQLVKRKLKELAKAS